MPESPERTNTSASLMVGLAAAVILALGVGVLVYNRQPPPPSSAPPPPASTAAGNVAPPAEASSTIAEPPRGSPAQPAAGQAPAAAPRPGAREPAQGTPPTKGRAAPRPPERPEPSGARGTQAPPAGPPLSSQAMLRRSFVPSRTASENIKGVSKTLSGFDSRKAKEVKVKRAPEIDGRIEFNTTPVRVKPGDKYSLRVALVNEGKRPIEIKELEVTTTLNRKGSAATVKPLVKQVAPRQNEVIHEISGTWDKSTASFSVAVRVMSDRLDIYRNELVWK